MTNQDDNTKIPKPDSDWSEKTKKYCTDFYIEKQNEIRFKKENLPPEDYKKYIHDNLKKWVDNLENWEREKRKSIELGSWSSEGGKSTEFDLKNKLIYDVVSPGDTIIQSTYFTLPLWKNEWAEIKGNESQKPNKKNNISHAKQMMLLDEIGFLDYLKKYNLSTEKKAYLISLIVGKNKQNTREYLTYGTLHKTETSQAKQKYLYRTPENVNFIKKIFSDLNIS
ncbi:MAG: hypothetical protein ISR57_00075 [Bacteroidales bacterium]|nr:hypothetical protein [candidate division KSB1 bacterium]MBL6949019.1 hypothetical protein [Bacteroidales bacterium]